MTKDELADLSWDIYQIMCKCDTQREAFNLIVATLGTFVSSQYEDLTKRVAALKFVSRMLGNFIENVEKGKLK